MATAFPSPKNDPWVESMTTLKAAIMLILVMDPMSNVPLFVSFLSGVDPRRARIIVVRELFVAFTILAIFLIAGEIILEMLQVSEPALSIAGGVILFLIALKMIFTSVKEIFKESPEGEPFIVPLMGLLLTAVAVQMFLTGIKEFFATAM